MLDIIMTTKELRKLEKIATESMKYAKKAIAKSNDLYTLLSLIEAKAGRGKNYSSVNEAFRKLKIS